MKTRTQQNERGIEAGGQDSSVLISGASLAGLASAYWMNRLGYAVSGR
jgi:monoamine oxidase